MNEQNFIEKDNNIRNKFDTIILYYSYHHKNTEKIAKAIGDILKAEVYPIEELKQINIDKYKLIGFGAGIDSCQHYKELIEFIDKIEKNEGKEAFIFSTSAIYNKDKMKNDHLKLRNILENNEYRIIGEFSCKGFNTNSFLKYFGGMNRGRPNDEDIKNAQEFAKKLLI